MTPTAVEPQPHAILGVYVAPLSPEEASRRVLAWAESRQSRYVCACNVHMVMEAHDQSAFRAIVNASDMVVPDGMPLVWALRLLGERHAERVYGPDLMLQVCAGAERAGFPIGLYGGSPSAIRRLESRLCERFPELKVVYAFSPRWRTDLSGDEDVEEIRASGAMVLFVALGCPKQERWMAAQRGRIPAVMIGVGAAFDFIAGLKPQAPEILRRSGLEWAFRLATEPRRLWRRYAWHNPRFVALFARELLARERHESP